MIKEIIAAWATGQGEFSCDSEVLARNLCQRGRLVHLEIAPRTVYLVSGSYYVREFKFPSDFARDAFIVLYKERYRALHREEPNKIPEAS